MDHTQFKANQTAAVYVADGLDESTQEAFELHMMDCSDCVSDVESWRAIKAELPNCVSPARPATGRRAPVFSDWRMAASLVGAGVVGATGGWVGKSAQTSAFDSTRTVVFNVPSVTRGAEECSVVQLAKDTRLAVLRVPGVSRDLRVVALDSEQRELPSGKYATRVQPDGSQLVQIDSQLLEGREVRLEARHADGTGEPVGCVTGQVSAPDAHG